MPYDDLIEKHARRVGLDPAWMRKIMQLESSGKADAVTGSYHGLFQLSQKEFTKHGGTGDIHDPEQNTMAAANKLSQEAFAFTAKYGRAPKLTDLYLVHQQGEAGYDAHAKNPEGTAWENVRKYYSSEAMAKKAIWDNLSPADKAKFGSVENVKSSDFIRTWGAKTEDTDTAVAGVVSKEKLAFMEGKDSVERKPSIMGSMDFDVPQPRIDLKVPEFTPRFKVG